MTGKADSTDTLSQSINNMSINNTTPATSNTATTNNNTTPPDGTKKVEFSQYLEKSGVIDALTKVLVGLYESTDKPVQPLEFIRDYLGGASAADAERYKAQVDDLKTTVEKQNAEIAELKKQLSEATAAKQ